MIKALAILRTVYLIFIVGYSIWAVPVYLTQASTHDESYARCVESSRRMMPALGLAVAWIALETAVGWLMASRRRQDAKRPPGEKLPPGEPPFAPPPLG